MQTTHDVWPELQDQDLPKGKLKWGDGLRSEEEEYIVTLGELELRRLSVDRADIVFHACQRTSWPT